MSDKNKISESTIARMAGNIAAGLVSGSDYTFEKEGGVIRAAVSIARGIADEVARTAPKDKP